MFLHETLREQKYVIIISRPGQRPGLFYKHCGNWLFAKSSYSSAAFRAQASLNSKRYRKQSLYRIFSQAFGYYIYKSQHLFKSSSVLPFLLFLQPAVQSTILFLFRICDKILHTSSVVQKLAAAAATIEEDMAVSDKLKWCLNIMVDSGGHRW